MRKLVLWGHHLDEYRDMFALNDADLKNSILEYGCGPSEVNAVLHRTSHIVSYDPLFEKNKVALEKIAIRIFDERESRIRRNCQNFDFSRYGDFEALVKYRRAGMQACFDDFDQGKEEGRYGFANSDSLPFPDFTFDYALSSHYFFAESDDASAVDAHVAMIRELARVAKDVRIFPLIDHLGQPNPLLGPVLLGLQNAALGVEVRDVAYRLQPAGSAMLRVFAKQCVL